MKMKIMIITVVTIQRRMMLRNTVNVWAGVIQRTIVQMIMVRILKTDDDADDDGDDDDGNDAHPLAGSGPGAGTGTGRSLQ